MYRSLTADIVVLGYLQVVYWPHPLIRVLVTSENNVHTIFVEEWLQSVE